MEDNINEPEESSWTFYIQGFMCEEEEDDGNNNNDDDCISESELEESPSLVSDAASSAAVVFKNKNSNDQHDYCSNNKLGFCSGMAKQNSMKKKKKWKNKVVPPVDYDLEDTASSPVSSPKVVCMNEFMGQKHKGVDRSAEAKWKEGAFGIERDSNNYKDITNKRR